LNTIVHVLPYMAEGGTEKHVLTLLRGFQKSYNSVLLAPRGKILNEFLKLNIRYVEFPEIKGNFRHKIRIFKDRLSEIYKEWGVDLVHVHAAHEFVLFSRKVLPETPIIFHLSAHQGSLLSRMFNYKLSAFISKRKAELLIAVSEEEKRLVVNKGYPEDRIRIVYNGYENMEGDDFNQIKLIKEKYDAEDCLIIGNLGRLNKTKRLDLLIRAFVIVKEKVKNKLKLIFIGNGPDRPRLEGIVHRNSLEKDVLFHGFVNRGDRVLKVFDIFVLPTSFEGCSNVLVEAMAKGLPIVTTDIPSVNWMFENGRDVLLFRENDVNDLSEKILELVNNESLRNNLAESAFIKFQKDFDAQIMIDRIDEIYQSLLS